LDISDVANGNLLEAAYFDIYPSSNSASFNGAWSNYPYFDSGIVVVSGIEQGLFVLQPNLTPPPPGPCSNLSDIPWVSVNPASGVTAVAQQNEIDIVFDSTGWATGSYTGTLCISSNDPDTPLVTVPVTMTVDATVPTTVGLVTVDVTHTFDPGVTLLVFVVFVLIVIGLHPRRRFLT
jgi:hypothetical protein